MSSPRRSQAAWRGSRWLRPLAHSVLRDRPRSPSLDRSSTGSERLPAGRTRRIHGAAVVAAAPLAGLIYLVVPTHHPLAVVVMGLGCLAATIAPLRWPALGAAGAAFCLALLVLPRFPHDAHNSILLLVGGAIALAIVVATDALRHPSLRLPELPAARRAPSTPEELRRHALRLGATIAVAATIVLVTGDASTFTARSSWMLIGVWIALQPQQASTRHVALQRGIGTAIGGLLTIPLALALPGTMWAGWILMALVFVSFGLRTVNYAWYCVVLTPIVVIGFAGGPLDVRVLAARVPWTAAGVLLAVLAGRILWTRSTTASRQLAVAA